MNNFIKGCDVSDVQGEVDFHWLVQQGFQFVIVKCFTGNDGKDSKYDENVAKARAAGLKVAAYHFIYPLPTDDAHPTRDPKVQAKLHYDAAGDVSVVACDLEWPVPQEWATKWNVNANFIKQWTLTYLAEYERLSGKRMILYTYPNFAQILQLSANPEFAQYPLWIASYTNPPTIPHPWTDYVLWQDGGGTSGHKLTLPNGIPVDSDVAKDLSLWDTTNTEVPIKPSPLDPISMDPVTNPIIINNPPPSPELPISNANFLTGLIQALQNLLKEFLKK